MKEFLLRLIGAIIDALAKPERKPEEEPDIPAPVPLPAPVEPQPVEEDTQPPDSGFLWKPISDGDGKLAVITPHQFEFSDVFVEWQKPKRQGTSLEKGRYIGRGNGNRQAFRFTKRGRAYPNAKVICTGVGVRKEFDIPDSSKRYETRVYGI